MPIYNAPILTVDSVETRRYAGLQKAEDFKQELIKWEPHTRDFSRELGDQASQRI